MNTYIEKSNVLAKSVVSQLLDNNETITTMESCTGGLLASELTNISGSSQVLKTSLVTYSNEYKEKFGVNEETIKKYSVYSKETAIEMAKCASLFSASSWGIGITGQIGRIDPENPGKEDNQIYYAIYNKQTNNLYTQKIVLDEEIAKQENRLLKKYIIVINILEMLDKKLKGEE